MLLTLMRPPARPPMPLYLRRAQCHTPTTGSITSVPRPACVVPARPHRRRRRAVRALGTHSSTSSLGSGSRPATCDTMNIASLVARVTASCTSHDRMRRTEANCSSEAAWCLASACSSSVAGCVLVCVGVCVRVCVCVGVVRGAAVVGQHRARENTPARHDTATHSTAQQPTYGYPAPRQELHVVGAPHDSAEAHEAGGAGAAHEADDLLPLVFQ